MTYVDASRQSGFPMSDDQRLAAKLLVKCRFLPGSWNKRFAKDIAYMAQSDEPYLTDRQSKTLWKLFYMHRKQISRMVEIVGNKRLFDIAKPIYDAERSKAQ